MHNNIILTTANSKYFVALLTLINGIHTYGFNCVDEICVYNLGLSDEEIKKLKNIKKVKLINYPIELIEKNKTFLDPKSHVYKLYCLYDGINYGKNVLWLDAGTTPINPMCEIFDKIKKDDIFMVVDVHKTGTYTHSNCVKIMNATEEELNDNILSSGIIGYSADGKYTNLFFEAFNFSMIEGCVDGDQENHRHDQSVLSILSTRYGCPKQDIDRYGYWTDINRNLKTALSVNAIIFVHRRGYENTSNIIYEN